MYIDLSTPPSGLSTFFVSERGGRLVTILFKVLDRNIVKRPPRKDQKALNGCYCIPHLVEPGHSSLSTALSLPFFLVLFVALGCCSPHRRPNSNHHHEAVIHPMHCRQLFKHSCTNTEKMRMPGGWPVCKALAPLLFLVHSRTAVPPPLLPFLKARPPLALPRFPCTPSPACTRPVTEDQRRYRSRAPASNARAAGDARRPRG